MVISQEPLQGRRPQLAYSELQAKTHDADRRRRKARKLIEVLRHFLGRDDLSGLRALDIGSSTGFTADALRAAGCEVFGVDIDLPGLEHARSRFGTDIHFIGADGSALPLPDKSVDIVLFNQVYEHVVDPDAVMRELKRVLRPDGAALFGFGNKYQLIEPHYRLPFLSWLPVRLADRYVAAFGRADDYYERFRSRGGLLHMCAPLHVWDYTIAVLCDPRRFQAEDVVPRAVRRLPAWLWRMFMPIAPTYLWIGTPADRHPAGHKTRAAPSRIDRGHDARG